jgi:phenylalanyl-tRNA synthetase beta chain
MKINENFLSKFIDDSLKSFLKKLLKFGFEAEINNKILNINIPYNRNDCLNFFGLLNYIYKKKFNTISEKSNIKSKKYNIDLSISVNINDINFCPFYSYLIFKCDKDISIPLYISDIIQNNDFILTNSIIDFLNYITFLTGQPLHLYDISKFKSEVMCLDKNLNNTNFITLNNEEISVKEDIHTMKNCNDIISLPGIVGSNLTKITKNSFNFLLESAYFNSDLIIKNSKLLSINTNSSKLFSNGINNFYILRSLKFFSQVFSNSNDVTFSRICKIHGKKIYDIKKIKLSQKKILLLLKNKYIYANLDKFLNKLNFKFKKLKKHFNIYVPVYRKDLILEDHIVSEIIKIYGYNKISTNNKYLVKNLDFIKKNNYMDLRYFFKFNGFNEIITYSFVNSKIERLFFNSDIIDINNPISNNMDVMRISLLQGLCNSFKYNENRYIDNINLFEIGKIYYCKDDKFFEKFNLSGICSENIQLVKKDFYNGFDKFFFLKSLIKILLNKFYNICDFSFKTSENIIYNKNLSLDIIFNNKTIGNIGLLNGHLCKIFDFKERVYYFDIFIEKLKREIIILNKLSKYPSIKRDISIIINNDIKYEYLISCIKNLNIKYLVKIKLINIFNIDTREKSYTFRFIFQSDEFTLKDSDINFLDFFEIGLKKFLKFRIKS